jgi:hypothetical protein
MIRKKIQKYKNYKPPRIPFALIFQLPDDHLGLGCHAGVRVPVHFLFLRSQVFYLDHLVPPAINLVQMLQLLLPVAIFIHLAFGYLPGDEVVLATKEALTICQYYFICCLHKSFFFFLVIYIFCKFCI